MYSRANTTVPETIISISIIIIIMNHNKQFYTRVYCLYITDYAVKTVFTAFLYFTSILNINPNS